MNLYLILQDTKNDYDTYDAAVVAAPSAAQAKAVRGTRKCVVLASFNAG